MPIPKHEAPKKREKKPAEPQQPNTVVLTGPEGSGVSMRGIQHDINHVAGLAGVEESLDWIAKGIGRLTSDDHSVGVAVSQNRYGNPVQLALTDTDGNDTMDRLVTAFERIADSVAKLAGLNRPRLESWHEQDEYMPRYKETACDGGTWTEDRRGMTMRDKGMAVPVKS